MGLFKVQPPNCATSEIVAVANTDVEVIGHGNVHTIAAFLRRWLRNLSNPLVPVELIPTSETMVEMNEFLGFVEKRPQVHQFNLPYFIGFFQELVLKEATNDFNESDIAMIFGPCIVNPAMRLFDRHAWPELDLFTQ
jgi:hypothetical protein